MNTSEKKNPMYTVEAFEPALKFRIPPHYKIIDGKGEEVAKFATRDEAERECKRLNAQQT